MYRRAMLRSYAESNGLDTVVASEAFERLFDAPVSAAPDAVPILSNPEMFLPADPEPGVPDSPAPDPLEELVAPPSPLPVTKPVRTRGRGRRRGLALLAASLLLTPILVILALWTGRSSTSPTVPSSASDPGTGAARAPEPQPVNAPAIAAAAPASVTRSIPPSIPNASSSGPARRPAIQPTATIGRTATPERAAPVVTATAGVSSRRATLVSQPGVSGGSFLTVTSQPAGARVTVNGTGWGTTPVTIRHLPHGTQRVRVTKEGYLAEERVAQVTAGQPATVRLVLRPQN